jgi:hypothetical protein
MWGFSFSDHFVALFVSAGENVVTGLLLFETYTFLTPGSAQQRTNVYAGAKD